MKFSLIASAVALFIVNALSAPPPTSPDPNQVYFSQSPTYGGSGCPQNSAVVILADDKKSFTIIMDQFIAQAGPNYTPKTLFDRKNCQINTWLHVPPGWQYSLFSATYRGFIYLQKGVSASLLTHYYFTGGQGQGSTQRIQSGPFTGDYDVTDKFEIATMVWSDCNVTSPLNINSEVRVDATQSPKSSGQITVDNVNGKVQFECGIQWRRCPS